MIVAMAITSPPPQEVGAQVDGWELRRYQRKLSLVDAVRISGLAKTTIKRFERGMILRPRIETAHKLAAIYDVTIREVLAGHVDEARHEIDDEQQVG